MSSDGQTLQYVAVNAEHQHERIEALNAAILFMTIAIFVSVMVVFYAIALSSQRKVTKIQTALDLLSDGDTGARCGLPQGNDDISSIAQQLDRALERLEVVTEQTRLFGKNLAHDLRTPLARLRASLEGSEKRHDDLTAALTEIDRIASIIDAMMRIARLQSEVSAASVTPLSLSSFAQRLYETYEPVLPERKTLLLEIDGDWVIRADEVLLEQAIANLLQNAIVHGGDFITLFTAKGVIGISDDGQGVPEDQFDEIIKPSVRLDPSRGEDGAGLGLAFVKAVADHHAARLVVEALTLRGIKFSLQFD
jgi:signal transduction histidine kinase